MIKRKIGLLLFAYLFLSPLLSIPLAAQDFSPKKLYKRYSKAVVFIFCTNLKERGAAGTGSIIRDDGLVLTNAHVIYNKEEDAVYKKIFIYLKPDNIVGDMEKDLALKYKAEVVSYDNDLDLALLKIKGLNKTVMPITFADPEEISIGEDVAAIGHPEQGGLWTLTTGTISAVRKDFGGIKGKDVFQTEASVNKGNSGGPLIDKRGYMVGINSNIARKNDEGLAITDINFSIKSSVAKDWLEREGYNIKFGNTPLDDSKISHKKKAGGTKKIKNFSKEHNNVKLENSKNGKGLAPDKLSDKNMSEKMGKGGILTPKRPYDLDNFVKKWVRKAEDEMEDLIKDLNRGGIDRQKKDIFDEL